MRRIRRERVYCLIGALAIPAVLFAQRNAPIPRGRVVWLLEDAVSRAGNRFRHAGQERWSANIDVSDLHAGGNPKAVSVTAEWPGKLVVSDSVSKAVFAPSRAKKTAADPVLNDVSEILLESTLDGFLALHLGGASTRIVGTAYPDPLRSGESCDVIVLRGPSRTKQNSAIVHRQYWFDSSSKRLVRVVFRDGELDVRLKAYARMGSDEFPQVIEVLDHGAPKYLMSMSIKGIGPATEDGTFDGN